HIYCFVGKIYGDRSIDGIRKTIDADDLLTRLLRESGLFKERGKAPSDPCQAGFMMRDCLHIQFMASNSCACERTQFRESAKMVDMSMGQKDMSQIGR